MQHTPTEEAAKFVPQLIDYDAFKSWIVVEDDAVLVVDKPGWVVCHPSKNGPLSSLVGVAKLHTGLETLHLVSRLDRETSGIVLFAKHRKAARELQMAFQERQVDKTYLAIVEGELKDAVEVNAPLAKDLVSPVAAKVAVRASRTAKNAQTRFEPLARGGGFSLLRVTPVTGRKHQIRAHAQHLGHCIVGDKLYGKDDSLFLEFIEHGWTARLDQNLAMHRQALHAQTICRSGQWSYSAPLPADMRGFCLAHGVAVVS